MERIIYLGKSGSCYASIRQIPSLYLLETDGNWPADGTHGFKHPGLSKKARLLFARMLHTASKCLLLSEDPYRGVIAVAAVVSYIAGG